MKMLSWKGALTGVIVAMFAQASIAQDQLFEEALTDNQAETIANDRRASLNSYFAKRSRLVKINVRALASDRSFLLEPFRDANAQQITVQRTSVEEFIPGSWRWIGEIVSPRLPVSAVNGPELTQEQQKELEVSAHQIELILVEIADQSEKPAQRHPGLNSVSTDQSFGIGTDVDESRQDSSFDPDKQYVVGGEFYVLALGGLFRIVSIESNPDVYAIFEIDHEKTFAVPEQGDLSQESDENRIKREDYEAYKKQVDSRLEGSK
jgi:hypothetical protein